MGSFLKPDRLILNQVFPWVDSNGSRGSLVRHTYEGQTNVYDFEVWPNGKETFRVNWKRYTWEQLNVCEAEIFCFIKANLKVRMT